MIDQTGAQHAVNLFQGDNVLARHVQLGFAFARKAYCSSDQLIGLPNGKLLVAGFTNLFGAPKDFLQARLDPDGALDTSFGTGGFLRTDFNATGDECHGVAIAGPDLLLTVGSVTSATTFDFGLARYIATTPVELLTFEVE